MRRVRRVLEEGEEVEEKGEKAGREAKDGSAEGEGVALEGEEKHD